MVYTLLIRDNDYFVFGVVSNLVVWISNIRFKIDMREGIYVLHNVDHMLVQEASKKVL